MLDQSIQDERLSRKERKSIRNWLREHEPDARELGLLRKQIFDTARQYTDAMEPLGLTDWIEHAISALHAPFDADIKRNIREAHFTPGDQARNRINSLLQDSRKKVDICVFTITDDEISREILAAQQRGIKIRLISDNDKSNDKGSDIDRLARMGVAVAIDRSDAHMHHKFALFDDKLLLTGSYNWTRSAAAHNSENLLVTSDSELLGPYRQCFDQMWRRWHE